MSKLFLWQVPMSPYVDKVKIALHEKGLAFDAAVPDGIGVGVSPALVAANPRSEAPVLIDGDTAIFDSSIILEYLEEQYPDTPLRAASPAARAHARMIEEVCDTHYEAINWGLFELNYFGRGKAEGMVDQLFAAARADVGAIHAWLTQQLGEADWFSGEAFGMADLVVAPFVGGTDFNGIPPQGALAQWFDRVNQRPSVAKVRAESLAGAEILQSVSGALDSGLLKRHYRDHRLEWMVRAGGMPVLLAGLAADNVRFTDLVVLTAP